MSFIPDEFVSGFQFGLLIGLVILIITLIFILRSGD
jgi:hypothetical protein